MYRPITARRRAGVGAHDGTKGPQRPLSAYVRKGRMGVGCAGGRSLTSRADHLYFANTVQCVRPPSHYWNRPALLEQFREVTVILARSRWIAT